jgi:hypothetical protein
MMQYLPGLVDAGFRAYLAVVLLASVASKIRTGWSSTLVAYGLWPPRLARALAVLVPSAEMAAAAALLVAQPIGYLMCGVMFIGYGHALAAAQLTGYRGLCGCSRGGRIAPILVARAYGWAFVTLVWGAAGILGQPVAAVTLFVVLMLVEAVMLAFTLLPRAVQRQPVRP